MVVLWLIEFLLVALIVVVLLPLGQEVIAHYRSGAAAQTLALELMRFEEAKTIVLQLDLSCLDHPESTLRR
jgi:hypothetical protein